MKRATKFLFAAAAATLFAGTATAQVAPASTGDTVAVHGDRPGAVYDRHIFGQFAEHLGTGIYPGIWVGKGSKIPNINGSPSTHR